MWKCAAVMTCLHNHLLVQFQAILLHIVQSHRVTPSSIQPRLLGWRFLPSPDELRKSYFTGRKTILATPYTTHLNFLSTVRAELQTSYFHISRTMILIYFPIVPLSHVINERYILFSRGLFFLYQMLNSGVVARGPYDI